MFSCFLNPPRCNPTHVVVKGVGEKNETKGKNVRNLLHVTFLAHTILAWLLGSRKICVHLCQGYGMLGVLIGFNWRCSQN
jgi:hypothetical protein